MGRSADAETAEGGPSAKSPARRFSRLTAVMRRSELAAAVGRDIIELISTIAADRPAGA